MKQVRLVRKVPPASPGLPVPKVLQVLPGLLAHKGPLVRLVPSAHRDLPA